MFLMLTVSPSPRAHGLLPPSPSCLGQEAARGGSGWGSLHLGLDAELGCGSPLVL